MNTHTCFVGAVCRRDCLYLPIRSPICQRTP